MTDSQEFAVHKLAFGECVKSFDCGDDDLNDFIISESFFCEYISRKTDMSSFPSFRCFVKNLSTAQALHFRQILKNCNLVYFE